MSEEEIINVEKQLEEEEKEAIAEAEPNKGTIDLTENAENEDVVIKAEEVKVEEIDEVQENEE